MSTPMDRLRNAVDTFASETDMLPEGATVSGIVLLMHVTRIDPEAEEQGFAPLVTSERYATDLPVATGAGLAAGFAHLTAGHVARSLDGADYAPGEG